MTLSFDHYTIKVLNLQRSIDFYGRILGLKPIENRTGKPHIFWFSIGESLELHLVEGEKSVTPSGIGVHLAFRTADFDTMKSKLEKTDITLHDSKGSPNAITTRADGKKQMYFQDPDGYWIEINDAS